MTHEAAAGALLSHTDQVAEIQNTVRRGVPVELSGIEVVTR
jgi:hypothetical protein